MFNNHVVFGRNPLPRQTRRGREGRSFQWSGWLVGSRDLGERWAAIGGVAYLRQLRSNWLPIGGLVWNPSEKDRWEFIFPQPKISRRIRDHDETPIWAYVGGEFGGGAWGIQDPPGANVLLGYSDLRLLTGVEAVSRGGYLIQAEFGFVFGRELSINSWLVEQPNRSLILRAALAF